MARWHCEFDARFPHPPHDLWKVGIQERLVKHLQGRGDKARLARIIPHYTGGRDISKNAQNLWWLVATSDDCYVYVGKPDRNFRSGQIQTPARPIVLLGFRLTGGNDRLLVWRQPAMRIRKHRKAWRENCYGNRRRAKESCRQRCR